MAIITCPLHSLSAHGQFGKAIIYQRRGRHTIAKNYATPGANKKPAQLAVQAETRLLMKRWPTLTPAQKASWEPLASQTNIEPINAFLKTNWDRYRQGLPTTDTPLETASVRKLIFTANTFRAFTFACQTLAGSADE